MRFGTSASLLTFSAAVVVSLLPFVAAAPSPTPVGSAPEPVSTTPPFIISVVDRTGEETIRPIPFEKTKSVDPTLSQIVRWHHTATLDFTPQEAADIQYLGYSMGLGIPYLNNCYVVFDDGTSLALSNAYDIEVENPSRVVCALIATHVDWDQVFTDILGLSGAGGTNDQQRQ